MVTKKDFQRKLAELFQTEDKDEQLEVAELLTNRASSPVIDIVVRFDARYGAVNVTTIGAKQGELSIEQGMDILEMGKKFLLRLQMQAVEEQRDEAVTGGPAEAVEDLPTVERTNADLVDEEDLE